MVVLVRHLWTCDQTKGPVQQDATFRNVQIEICCVEKTYPSDV